MPSSFVFSPSLLDVWLIVFCWSFDDIHSAPRSNVTIEWGYEDKNTSAAWCAKFPHCCGTNQSPIDVDTNLIENVTVKPARDLAFYGAYAPEVSSDWWMPVTAVNTGRTVDFRVIFAVPMTLSGGACSPSDSAHEVLYSLVSFHFHWGGSDKRGGSEHSFNGYKYPLEMHLVHRNLKYATFDEAKTAADGIVVVAVFFENVTVDSPSPLFAALAKQLPAVRYARQNQTFMLSDLSDLLPDDRNRYYCYFGSLTTPTCNEAVTWMLLKKPIPLDRNFLDELRQLERSDGEADDGQRWPIADNFRPSQPLNSRKVRFYEPCNH